MVVRVYKFGIETSRGLGPTRPVHDHIAIIFLLLFGAEIALLTHKTWG
jgi:hypothetical protein